MAENSGYRCDPIDESMEREMHADTYGEIAELRNENLNLKEEMNRLKDELGGALESQRKVWEE